MAWLDEQDFNNSPNIFPNRPPLDPIAPVPGAPKGPNTKGDLGPIPPNPANQLPEWPSFSFTMPEMPDYAAMYAEMQAKADEAAGIRDRDTAYGYYLDAANDAVSYIDADIGQKEARANLMGVDYFVSDEDRAVRVNDYFASIWSEGSQNQLNTLMSKWGNPEGFDGFTLERGDPTDYMSEAPEASAPATNAKTILPTETSASAGILTDNPFQDTGQLNLLGV